MSDPTWRDPFEDDAARERAARRAQREQRRREEEAQSSLGDRVREEMDARDAKQAKRPPEPKPEPEPEPEPEPSPKPEPRPAQVPPPPPPQPAAIPEPVSEPAGPTEPEAPPEPEATHDPLQTDETASVPPRPPRGPRGRPGFKRRRLGALVGLLALIGAVVAGAAFVANRESEAPAPAPTKERKTIEVVVPEGFDRTQVAKVARKAGLKGNYIAASKQSKAIDLKKLGAGGAGSLEGFLFPATYEVFKGSNVNSLVRKQVEAFEDNAAEANLAARAKKMGFSVYELVIVASMVEREIAVPEERGLAASVIFNRLETGTPLGIDSTIRFEDQNYTEPLVQSRLDSATPYNTRLNTGLPPGPIGNPGLASLKAAADPPKTDFFFFVIKPGTCNEHTFVETDAEFAQAEAAYQAALEAEGGSPTEC